MVIACGLGSLEFGVWFLGLGQGVYGSGNWV